MELLRKKDLHPQVGVAKSTVADWIEDFNIYIPQLKQGNVTYYRPETIDVLAFIKQCREQGHQKQQIMEALSSHGFPVTIEEAREDAAQVLDYPAENHEDVLSVMQTMGQAVQKLSDQDESIKTLQERDFKQEGRIEDVEKRTEQTHETVEALQQEIAHLREELAATKQEKKGFFKRLLKGGDKE